MTKLIIVGGGLAGCLAAKALAARRPELDLLLIEQGIAFGGNHTWSWFDTDVAVDERWVLDRIAARHWPDHDIIFPGRRRTLAIGYNSMRSADLDEAVRRALKPRQYRLGEAVAEFSPRHVTLETGERFDADAVIDARGPGQLPGQALGWQKFVGRIYRFERPHGVERPCIMDATIAQHDGYRFLYSLPLSGEDMLLEDTYYSADPMLDRTALSRRLDEAAAAIGAGRAQVREEESGVLPVLIDGDFEALWPASDPLPRLGVRGGFFHPTTSYSLPDAVANAALLAGLTEFSADSLASMLRARAGRLWRERRYFEFLNRMLFRAAAPDQRYKVFEHFYRLPADVIARFYAAQLTGWDKVRILSGKPPVPVGKAVSAIFAGAR